MPGVFIFQRSRRYALALFLSLLVAVFAVEAKMAWFSPAGSPECEIQTAKAWPGETSQMVARSASVANTFNLLIPAVLLLVSAACLNARTNLSIQETQNQAISLVAETQFHSPHLFFRPPPSR
jgi:hypothetical protein